MSGLIPVTDDAAEPPEIDVLAGEYVLGVLTADEMQMVRRRARIDPALDRAIRRWEGNLLPLAALVPDVAPPAALWQRIADATAPLPLEAANDAVATPASISAPIPAPTPVMAPFQRRTPPAARPARVWPWQVSTIASLALAAGLAAVAFLPQFRTPVAPSPAERVAAIGPVGAPPPAFLANAAADGHVVLTALSPADVPGGHDLELWVLPPGAKTVASLGVLPAGGRTVALPSLPATGTQLLVSLEPAGGSPSGQPTGPVLYAGTLAGP